MTDWHKTHPHHRPDASALGALYTRLNQLARQIAKRQARGLPIDDKQRAEVASLKAEIAAKKGKP